MRTGLTYDVLLEVMGAGQLGAEELLAVERGGGREKERKKGREERKEGESQRGREERKEGRKEGGREERKEKGRQIRRE